MTAWLNVATEEGEPGELINDPEVVLPALDEIAQRVRTTLIDEGAERAVVVSVPADNGFTLDDEGRTIVADDDTMLVPEIITPEWCADDDVCEANYYQRSGAGNDRFVIVAPDDLETALGTELSSRELQAFSHGEALITDPQWLDGEAITVNEWRTGELRSDPEARPEPIGSVTLPAVLISTETNFDEWHQVYISPETAADLGIRTQPGLVVASFRDITTSQLDALDATAESMSNEPGELFRSVSFSQIQRPPAAAPWLWLILGAVTVLVIAASAVSLGLSRVERRPDDATLTAVGSPPRVRRSVNAWQALVISGFGCVVGTVAGLMPVLGVVFILDGTGQEGLTFGGVPWLWYAILALALPIAVALVSWLVPPRTPDLTRRTAIA